MQYDVGSLGKGRAAALFPTLLAPRPVVLIGTYDADAARSNLAPYSSVGWVSNNPPLVTLSLSRRKSGAPKETCRLAEKTGELVLNLVTSEQALQAVECARPLLGSPEAMRDDYERVGLSRVDFGAFAAGRVAESPAALGCRIVAWYDLPGSECRLAAARVELIYVSDEWVGYGDRAAHLANVVAGIATEQYVALGDASPVRIPRSWDE